MQKPYKFLNVQNHEQVSQEVLAFIEQHTNLINNRPQFWNPVEIKSVLRHVPSLKQLLTRCKLIPIEMSVIIFDPATTYTRIHADPLETYVRLLWPVKNCQGSVTKFYDIPKELLVEGTETDWKDPSEIHLDHYTDVDQGVWYPPLDREWPQIDQVELLAPIAFDGSVPHSVHPAPGMDFRISFTIFFDQNLPISKSIDAWTDIFLRVVQNK
jgi:hypothetical protein